jgi:carotenoid cleavage dioxygenase-like enzyme
VVPDRFVRSAEVATALGEPIRSGPVHAEMDFAADTNVIGHAGHTFAIVEAGARPYELTYQLDTVGPSDFGGTLSGGYTAHPKRVPDTGELHAISYYWGWGNRVQYTVTDVDGRVRKAVDIEVGGPASIHDMSLTERFAVIYDLPVVFGADAAMSGSQFPYRWDPGYRPRGGLLEREGGAGDVNWLDVEPCYVFHPMNAYDDGDQMVVDPPPEGDRHLPSRSGRGPAQLGPLDARPGDGQGRRGTARRLRPGVPAGRRAPRRAAAPVRLHRGHARR